MSKVDLPKLEVAFDDAYRALSLFSGKITCNEAPPASSSVHIVSPSARERDSAIQRPQRAFLHDISTNIGSKPINIREGSAEVMRPQPIHESALSLPHSNEPEEKLEISKGAHVPDFGGSVTTFTPSLVSKDRHINDTDSVKSHTNSSEPLERFFYNVAGVQQLDVLTAAHPLPRLSTSRWWRVCKYGWASAYRKLWTLAVFSNMVVIIVAISYTAQHPGSFTYGEAATATGANLLMSALMRHEHMINLLYRMACSLPHCTPLCVRRQAAKVYSYGGIHSGCGISAFLWYILYAVLAVHQFEGTDAERTALAATISATLWLLTVIIGLSHPYIRRRWHNQWELSHRIGGWTAVALVWAQTMIVVVARANSAVHSVGTTLIKTPTFWFLVIITCCLIYPWLRLRKRSFTPQKLSDHAVRLHFEDNTHPTCVGYRLSNNPLVENHGFATIPNADGRPGYSIVISNAGDWTKKLINNPPPHIWTRGAATTGVMRIASLFRPIVVVATGSGIGPCLSFLQVHPHHPMRIIWSARCPETTYGSDIIKAVLKADRRAIIIDTKKTGHPNLVALAYSIYEGMRAEAMVIISNPAVTKKVVFELESRRVPAFGAIFDS